MEATAQLVQLFSIYLLNMLSVHNYVCHISFCNVLYVCIYIYNSSNVNTYPRMHHWGFCMCTYWIHIIQVPMHVLCMYICTYRYKHKHYIFIQIHACIWMHAYLNDCIYLHSLDSMSCLVRVSCFVKIRISLQRPYLGSIIC